MEDLKQPSETQTKRTDREASAELLGDVIYNTAMVAFTAWITPKLVSTGTEAIADKSYFAEISKLDPENEWLGNFLVDHRVATGQALLLSAGLLGGVGLVLASDAIGKGTQLIARSAQATQRTISKTQNRTSAKTAPNGHLKPTPRLNYDVRTGLPNHRATPQEAEGILAELHWQERTDSVLASPKPSEEARNNTLRRARLHEEVWGKPTLLVDAESAQATPTLNAEARATLLGLVFDGSYREHADGFSVDDESDEYDGLV